MSRDVLVFNPGSSTLKFDLYRWSGTGVPVPDQFSPLAQGIVERLGTPQARLKLEIDGQPTREEASQGETFAHATETILQALNRALGEGASYRSGIIGCRIVHGGTRFVEPTKVTPEVVQAIRDLSPLAPLHNPSAADVLDACLRLLPDAPTIACFDTAFHRTLPPVAATYGIPRELAERHTLRRFGFHGLAHAHVSRQLIGLIEKTGQPSRCITCHLGNGASVCAIRDGESIDTSMGLTPMEGLLMGTRSGDVDPGLILFLLQQLKMSPEQVEEALFTHGGLLGISGRSGDMRDLEQAAAQGDAASQLAIEVFAYRVAKTIGAYAAALEGVDAIAFSGGIGEHSVATRERVCHRLSFLGLSLDPAQNVAASGEKAARISTADSRVPAWVIPADESIEIAVEIAAL